jgi:hypothetical protein
MPPLNPRDDDFNKLAFVLCLKTFMQIRPLWAHWFLRRSFKYVPFISTCKNHNLYKLESALCQEAFMYI